MAQEQQTRRKRKAQKVTLPRGIRQRTSGRFIIDLTVNGERKTATTDTVEEAIAKRAEMLAEGQGQATSTAKGNASKNSAWTLQDAFERTLAQVWTGLSSEKTARINSKAALNFFGADTPVASITPDDIDRYVTALITGGDADGTVNRKMSVLSRMFRTAHERGQLDHIPKLPRRKEKQGRIRFLSAKEETTVLALFLHIDKADHWDATVILIDTGFRTGELWRVTAEHIDFNRGTYGTITLWRTKNGKARTIPMTHRVLEIVSRRAHQHPSGPLFPEGGKDWYRKGWDRVRLLMDKEDDAEFVPHALRHTCCSRLVQRGVPLPHVQKWMGHNSIQTTMRYAHLMPHDLFAAVAVLEGGDNARWDAVTGHGAAKKRPGKALLQ